MQRPAGTAPIPPLLFTKNQAAAMLAISVRQLERLVAGGEVIPTRLGGTVRFSRAALEAVVESHTASPVVWPSRYPAERRPRHRDPRVRSDR
jgi:excisionase family DNA binding protein